MEKSNDKKNAILDVEEDVVHVHGELNMDTAGMFYKEALTFVHGYDGKEIILDLSNLKGIDSAGATAIHVLENKCKDNGVKIVFMGAAPSIKIKLDLFKNRQENISTTGKKKTGLIEKTGEKVHGFVFGTLKRFIQLSADTLYWSFTDIFNTRHRRKGEFVKQAHEVGVNAIPIVVAMSFIIGLVLALQSASQLRNFGANIYIVDLVVISMMGEMGPLITAILVAGRSGSSIAAEIATMKVTSELDALVTMGFNPVRFVVVPKMLGSVFTLPFLTILANMAGILGGAIAANIYLDITPEIFFNRMSVSLYNKDIITGIIKSIVFAGIIVLTGSYFGFIVERGAEGVGRVTTKSVVAAISLVIIADSIMGLIFY